LAQQNAEELIKKPPLSKYGIRVQVRVRPSDEWRSPRRDMVWSRIRLEMAALPEPLDGQRLAPSIDSPLLLIQLDARILHRLLKGLDMSVPVGSLKHQMAEGSTIQ